MGTCRALSLLVGSACATARLLPAGDTIYFALLIMAYIASVTTIARREMGTAPIPVMHRYLPGTILLAGLSFYSLTMGPSNIIPHGVAGEAAFSTISCVAVAICFVLGARLAPGTNIPIQKVIGGFIGVILLVQAAMCTGPTYAAGFIAAGILIVAYPLFGMGARRVASS